MAVAGGNGRLGGAKGKWSLNQRERETLESMRFLLYRKLYVNFDPFGFKFKSMNQNFLEFAG